MSVLPKHRAVTWRGAWTCNARFCSGRRSLACSALAAASRSPALSVSLLATELGCVQPAVCTDGTLMCSVLAVYIHMAVRKDDGSATGPGGACSPSPSDGVHAERTRYTYAHTDTCGHTCTGEKLVAISLCFTLPKFSFAARFGSKRSSRRAAAQLLRPHSRCSGRVWCRRYLSSKTGGRRTLRGRGS